MHALSRFSPGYGDFPVAYQPDMLRLTRADRLGMAATGGNMLAPVKSVTAVIGLSDTPKSGGHNCESCDKSDCQFRKETRE